MTGNGFPPHSTIELNRPPGAAPTATATDFDPRESFYPTTLLKAEDVRITMPRVKAAPRGGRVVKVLVALVLALSAALAYVLFSKPQDAAPKEAARPAIPEGKPSAVGTIVPPAAAVAQPAVIEAPKAATAPAPAATAPNVAKAAPASTAAPRSPSPRSTEQAPAATGATFVVAPDGARPVTHTKASAGATEAQAGAPTVSPAASVIAVPPPSAPAPARSANCSDALAALGLCAPSK